MEKDYQNQWTKNNKDSMKLNLPKGYKEMLKQLSEETNQSVTDWIKQAINERAEAQKGLFLWSILINVSNSLNIKSNLIFKI